MRTRHLVLGRALFWPALGVLAPQALRLRRDAPRFAPATGPTAGQIAGASPALRVLGIGDSIVAGVGLSATTETMPVRVAHALGSASGRAVSWTLLGESGRSSAGVVSRLLPQLSPEAYTHVIVSVGVNDVTGPRRTEAWRSSVDALARGLRAHSPDAAIVFAGLPPLHRFPLLPEPLRAVLGARAKAFDAALAAACETMVGVYHVPTAFEPEPSRFAADGYHPNAESHAIWGAQIAGALASFAADAAGPPR